MDGEADDDDFELPFEYTPHPLVVGCHRHNHPHHHHNHLHCEHHYVCFLLSQIDVFALCTTIRTRPGLGRAKAKKQKKYLYSQKVLKVLKTFHLHPLTLLF